MSTRASTRGHARRLGARVGVVVATALTSLAVTAGPATAAPPAPAAPPSSYGVVTLLDGLSNPWAVDFAPGASAIFLTERSGTIGRLRDGQFQRFPRWPDVVANGEGGMLGLAVDPSFGPRRPYIYVCFQSNRGGTRDVRIARASVSRNVLYDRRDIVTGIPTQTGRHTGCRLKFGPDGYLWATTGDAALGTVPQNPRSLGGKVLRMTTSGTGAGNLGSGFLPHIYAFGFRNPQGIDFLVTPRTGTFTPYIIEHGPGRDDEITPVRRRGNGGWNPVGGGREYNEAVPMTDTRYANVLRPVWTSGNPTIAPSGGSFVTHPDWGDYQGRMAVGVLKGQQLRIHAVTGGDPGLVLRDDFGRVRTAEEGPDGFLYVLTDANPGRMIRIDPVA